MSDALFKCQKSAFQYIIHKDVGSIDFSLGILQAESPALGTSCQ